MIHFGYGIFLQILDSRLKYNNLEVLTMSLIRKFNQYLYENECGKTKGE